MSQIDLDGPGARPPEGELPNFDDPPNQNAAVHVMLAVCLALTSVSLLLRLYTRCFCTRQLKLIDVMGVLAFVTYIASIWTSYRQLFVVGYFVQQWNIPLRDVFVYLYYGFINISMYSFTIMLLKAAILLEWVRIFVPEGTRGWFFWTCHALLWVNVLFYIAILVAVNLACTPYAANWDKSLPATCLDVNRANMASAVVNFAFDLAISALPQRRIWALHMSRQKRLGVSVVFAIGLLACATAGIRTGLTIRALVAAPYTTYSYSQLSLCCLAEMTGGFLVLCVPTAPKALRALRMPGILSTLKKSWTGSSRRSTAHRASASWPRASSSLKPPQYIYGNNNNANANSRNGNADERGLIGLEELSSRDSTAAHPYDQHSLVPSPRPSLIRNSARVAGGEGAHHGGPDETYARDSHSWKQDAGSWERRY